MDPNIRENIAAVQHEIWSHWMRYLFSQCQKTIDGGNMIIPSSSVNRWKRQMETDYNDLTKKEQRSDLEQADKVLSVLIGE